MFTASEPFYDLIYSTFKDYAREAAQIGGLLRQRNPACSTVLDVACGTGAHARLLAAQGFIVDGIDLDPAFVHIAEQKHPSGRFVVADMSDFDLSRQYDAVLCLFSSIGYLKTVDRLIQALTCFRRHLTVGGTVIIEPWLRPGVLDPTHVARHLGEANGVRVSRTTRVEVAGAMSRLLFDYEITDATGTRYASEVHELGLFTADDWRRAFLATGFEADHDPKGLSDRGLYVARVQ